MTNSKTQHGVFSIEMAFVLVGMCAALYFCFDLGYQQMKKSQLERVSYSLVSVLKERSLAFDKRENVDKNEMHNLQKLAAKLLSTEIEKVSVVVDYRIGQKRGRSQYQKAVGDPPCNPHQKIDSRFDVTLEKSGKKAPVYQVTVCQQVPAWFEKAINGKVDFDDRILQAQSTFLGR